MVLALLCAIALQTAAPQSMTIIARDMMSQVDSPRVAVARTSAEWAALWRQHTGDGAPPAVDLNTRTVVAVFLGSRPSAGFAVDIVGTREANGTLIVQWQERRPSRDMITAQVLTAPAVIASLPKFTGEIAFEKVEP
jgi:hypothetical protein